MAKKFDYQGALDAGYSDEEIMSHLSEKHPSFDMEAAAESGYSPQEINQYLSTYQRKKSPQEKAGRLAAQYGLGVAEGAAFVPKLAMEIGRGAPGGLTGTLAEIGVAGPVGKLIHAGGKKAEEQRYREEVLGDIERLQEQKSMGQWDEQDQQLYDSLVEQIKNPDKAREFVKSADDNVDFRNIAEKATGYDLHPEGVFEKAANWAGFLKDPKKITELAKVGLTPKNIAQAILPGIKDTSRSLGAGLGLELAEQGAFGPLGTLAMAIAGDAAGHAPTSLLNVAKNPKKAIASLINLATQNNSKKQIAKQISEDFAKSGMSIDAGSLTQSDLVKFIQARAAQSGLVGESLTNFRKNLSDQVMREYGKVADDLSNIKFSSDTQAAEAIRSALKTQEESLGLFPLKPPQTAPGLRGRISTETRETSRELSENLVNRISPIEFQNDYVAGETLRTVAEDTKQPLQEQFNERWSNFNNSIAHIEGPQPRLANELENFVENHRGSLLLGESVPEFQVVQAAERLMNALQVEGGYVNVSLADLIKTKRTLQDVANYEFGGSNFESAYKNLVGDIDRAIDRTLERSSPELLEQFEMLNADYSNFKSIFENKSVLPLFERNNQDFIKIYNSFSADPDRLRLLEDMLYTSPRGQELVNMVKRDYAENILQNPNVTPRQLRNLSQILGEPFSQEIPRIIEARRFEAQHPLPRARTQERIPIEIPRTQSSTTNLRGRAKETPETVRRKMYDSLKGKSSEQIMAQMDTVDGIRKLKKVLELTDEGKKLFKELARYKLEELIGSKMKDQITEQVKLRTFSNLLKSSENRAVVKELVGQPSFDRLLLLQKNAGVLAESAEKFFNASKSGSTMQDVGLASTAVIGAFTLNPYMALPAIATIGGLRVVANLFSDPVFLKYLEQAILAKDPKKFQMMLQMMKPSVQQAIKASIPAMNHPQNSEQ
jgi:hypothetical protein